MGKIQNIGYLCSLFVFIIESYAIGESELPKKIDDVRIRIERDKLQIQFDENADLYVVATPFSDELCSRFILRVRGEMRTCSSIKQYIVNSRNTDEGFRFPLEILKPSLQRQVLLNVFDQDELGPNSWQHKCVYVFENGVGETLDKIAKWFTGDSKTASHLLTFNGLKSDALLRDQVIRIPRHLLLPYLQHQWVEENEKVGELTYHNHAQGPYAGYFIKDGEALYSDVVLKFTDRVQVTDVMEAVDAICIRNAISDVRNIPAGSEIKIPIELISLRYLPLSSPLRQEYERDLEASKAFKKAIVRLNLENVVVILDSGHGGEDPGAMPSDDVAEDEYVYDIACRVKRIIQSETKGTVRMLIRDTVTGYKPSDCESIPLDKNEVLVTTPPYNLLDTLKGVNLRWILGNYIYNGLIQSGSSNEQVLFLSIHADVLHPQVNGTMIYYPSAAYRKGRSPIFGGELNQYAECNNLKRFKFERRQLLQSERLSLDLAQSISSSLAHSGIEIHKEQPIRGSIYRSGSRFLPAVLQYTQIPTALLIETVNLKNQHDYKKIREYRFRELFARSVVTGIINYYSTDRRNNSK